MSSLNEIIKNSGLPQPKFYINQDIWYIHSSEIHKDKISVISLNVEFFEIGNEPRIKAIYKYELSEYGEIHERSIFKTREDVENHRKQLRLNEIENQKKHTHEIAKNLIYWCNKLDLNIEDILNEQK